jgi:very-short-patch-repair endonuclease
MRRAPTPAERVLWQQLRANRSSGIPFRRQVILGGFIVDFYCHQFQLAIEVDGDVHDLQPEYDAERTQILNDMGVGMIRFHNDEVLGNVFAVVKSILNECAKRSAAS